MNILQQLTLNKRLTAVASLLVLSLIGISIALIQVIRSGNHETELHQFGSLSRDLIQAQMTKKDDLGRALTTAFSLNGEVRAALEMGNREGLRSAFNNVKGIFAENSKFKNIAVEIIDANGRSLMRSWEKQSAGARPTDNPVALEALKKGKIHSELSHTSKGIVFSTAIPVKTEGRVLGSLVLNQGLRSIDIDFISTDRHYALVVEKSIVGDQEGKNQSFGNQYVSANDRWLRKESIDSIAQADMAELLSSGFYETDQYVYFAEPIVNSAGQRIGWHAVSQNRKAFANALNERNLVTNAILAAVVITSLVLMIGYAVMVQTMVTRPLSKIQNRIVDTSDTGDLTLRLPKMVGKDELSVMSRQYNRMLDDMSSAFSEITLVTEALAAGQFDKRVDGHLKGDLLSLSQAINTSVDGVAATMAELTQLSAALKQGDLKYRSQHSAPGAFGVLVDNVAASMTGLSRVLNEINHVMDGMAAGEFSQRAQSPAEGDLAAMQSRFNTAADNIERAISELSKVTEAQMSGDLTRTVEGEFSGDLHLLTSSVNSMTKHLSQVISDLKTSATATDQAASDVYSGSLDLSERAKRQAAEVDKTVSAMEEINRTVQQNSQNAIRAMEIADTAKQQSNLGKEVMSDTIEAMETLSQESQKISEIINLIDEIAFQTNLLALNAAVEAARAGDHGRGFAVVASEVRNLAQRSAEAANTIKDLVKNSVERIERGTKLVAKSGETLFSINESVAEVDNIIKEISVSSGEQEIGIGQISEAITRIDHMTQQYTGLAQQATDASLAVRSQSEAMSGAMEFFQVQRATNNPRREFEKAKEFSVA